jgi:hypothetical protein
MKVDFFFCPECKNFWRYVTKIVERAKCLNCWHSIKFNKVKKEAYDNVPSLGGVVEIFKRIRLREGK